MSSKEPLISVLIDDRHAALAILNRIAQEGGATAQAALDGILVSVGGGNAIRVWKALVDAGLVVVDGATAVLSEGADQYIARDDWDEETLGFLPHAIANLHTRRAFLNAGGALLDEFTVALRSGEGEGYVREFIVPPAFVAAVDRDLICRLYAAASALITRLVCGTPAGCVAEEIIAVRLCALAEFALDDNLDAGLLNVDEYDEAHGHIGDLWGFFQDEDVALLFDMREPADAAVAMHSEALRDLGIADQRLPAWFEPFWGLPATGHLRRAVADGAS